MKKSELAWCGGFFEGEGHTSAGISYRVKHRSYKSRSKYHTFCRALVNQKYKDVLLRFKRYIGFGKVAGPYVSPPHCSYYVWRVSAKADVAKLFKLLKPYLSSRRKTQFRKALKGEFKLKST